MYFLSFPMAKQRFFLPPSHLPESDLCGATDEDDPLDGRGPLGHLPRGQEVSGEDPVPEYHGRPSYCGNGSLQVIKIFLKINCNKLPCNCYFFWSLQERLFHKPARILRRPFQRLDHVHKAVAVQEEHPEESPRRARTSCL